MNNNLNMFLWYSFVCVVVTLLVFFGLSVLHVQPGQLVDWITGMLTLWWLLIIVTVPWNVHFEAKAVLDEFAHSRSVGITVDEKHAKYVSKVFNYSLWLAIILHVASAAALFALSATGVSHVGYIGSAVALLLTVVRPAVRAYEYMWQQLTSIKHRVRYPREDVIELRERTKKLESEVKELNRSLDKNITGSFACEQNRSISEITRKCERLGEQQARETEENLRQHESLLRDGQAALAKISSDTQFLDHVREIVRLIKTA